MGSTDEVEVVFVEELCRHLGAESEGDAAVVLAPSHCVLHHIQQRKRKTMLKHCAFLRHFIRSVRKYDAQGALGATGGHAPCRGLTTADHRAVLGLVRLLVS